MTNLRYTGPIDEITVDGVGDVPRMTSVSVPSEIAGRAPDARLEQAMSELHAAISASDHNLAAALRDEIVGLDPGEGLLAQSSWQLAKKAPKETGTEVDA